LGKKFSGVSQTMSRFRGWIQAGATLLTNLHLPNFLKGGLYQGTGKTVCVPGLNCYSCPAASGACPIGAFQAVVGSSKFSFSYYITGFLILLGVLLGRFICGFLCPFGWFQELLHKIPTKKLSTKRLKPLTYLKYAVLLVMVFLLPAFLVNDVGMGDPFFCKYLCPQGVLEGDRRPPRRLRLGREKFGEGHYHCGGVANATINEALKPFYSFFAASLAALRRSSLYGAVSRKEKRPFSISNSLQPVSGSTSVSLQTAGCLRLYAVSLFLRSVLWVRMKMVGSFSSK